MTKFNLVPTTMAEAKEYATLIATSTMIPRDYQGKAANILVAMQWGMMLGMPPLQALQGIAVINGRPCLWGDALLAIAQNHKDFVDIIESVEESDNVMAAKCIVKRKDRQDTVVYFSADDAKRAGLWGKQGPWTSYPKRMLQMRARAFALRNSFADALMGIQSAEEISDYDKKQDVNKIESILEQIKSEHIISESVADLAIDSENTVGELS